MSFPVISARARRSYSPGRPLLAALALLLLVAGAQSELRAATFNVGAGGNLQAALDAAQFGDTIIVEAGATYIGPFFLLPKSGGTGTDSDYITVRSSRLSELPEGARVTPAQVHLMARLVTPGDNFAVLRTRGLARHYRFLGLELMPATSEAVVFNLIDLGDDGNGGQTTLDRVPHHFVFDRCYIHAWPGQDVVRGFALNSSDTDITNSHLSEFKSQKTESQAILAWNTPGRIRIINNYLEGATENLQFGGGGAPAIPGLVPSDIEVRRNHLSRPLAWRGVWLVKNLFELKNARRVVVDGNILEHNWADGQVGYAVQLTPRTENGLAPWATVEDITFTNNIVRYTSGGINILGRDNALPREQVKRVTIRNNVFYGLGSGLWGGVDDFIQLTETDSVRVEHNTVFQHGNILSAYGVANTNFVFTDNITPHNRYGIHGGGQSPGNASIAAYFPGGLFRRNVMAGAEVWNYPPDNFYPALLSAVGFVDLAGGNYRLAEWSPYRGQATDGRDVGVDFDELEAAQGGTVTPPAPGPTPTPTPTPTPAPTPAPTPGTRVNVALASNGGVAAASSTHSPGFAPSGAINGQRSGAGWGAGGGWNDATQNTFPDSLEVSFAVAQTIDEVDVFSLQDNYQSPAEPTEAQTFTLYGLTNFEVQYWDGVAWQLVPGGEVTGNNLVWRKFTFAAVTTTRIRVVVNDAADHVWSRITEVEAYTPGDSPTPTPAPDADTVWVEDTTPAGANLAGDGEGWSWVGANPAPFSGTLAHESNIVGGMHQHYFFGATETLSVNAGETLFAYVYLDPANMPSQVMLQWYENGSWEHRAYWGANSIGWGADGTESRRYMGSLPAAGQWVRLEVPASLVGLEGRVLNGAAFTLFGGRATWDRAGKITVSQFKSASTGYVKSASARYVRTAPRRRVTGVRAMRPTAGTRSKTL